jgi:hypothetical protein
MPQFCSLLRTDSDTRPTADTSIDRIEEGPDILLIMEEEGSGWTTAFAGGAACAF